MIKKLPYIIILGILLMVLLWLSNFWKQPDHSTDTISEKQETGQKPPDKQSQDVDELSSPRPVDGTYTDERMIPPTTKAFVKAFYGQRIAVYGKVIDQWDQPVAGAKVRLGVHDNPMETGTSYYVSSDAKGLFELTGVRGAAVNIEVSMDGYYAGGTSRKGFKPGELPPKNTPAVFILHKKGELEPVYYHKIKGHRLPIEGGEVYYDFKKGTFAESEVGPLRVRIRTVIKEGYHLEWEYEVEVKGGGLKLRSNEFDFIAPEEGYAERIFGYYKRENTNWRGSYNIDSFIKLPDGSFARATVFVFASGGASVRLDNVVYNPSGSRNLEFDTNNPNAINR